MDLGLWGRKGFSPGNGAKALRTLTTEARWASLINHVEANDLSGTTSLTLAAPALNVASGDLLYVFTFNETTTSAISFTDSLSQTWKPKTQLSDNAVAMHARHGYILSSGANASLVVTAHWAAARAYRRSSVLQFRPGGGETLAFDKEQPFQDDTMAESVGGPPITLSSGSFVTVGASIIAAGFTEEHSITWTDGGLGYTIDSTGDPCTVHKITGSGATENVQVKADRDAGGGGNIEYVCLAAAFTIQSRSAESWIWPRPPTGQLPRAIPRYSRTGGTVPTLQTTRPRSVAPVR